MNSHDWIRIRRRDLDQLIYYAFAYGIHADKEALNFIVKISLSLKDDRMIDEKEKKKRLEKWLDEQLELEKEKMRTEYTKMEKKE